jgi:hypothetical protein
VNVIDKQYLRLSTLSLSAAAGTHPRFSSSISHLSAHLLHKVFIACHWTSSSSPHSTTSAILQSSIISNLNLQTLSLDLPASSPLSPALTLPPAALPPCLALCSTRSSIRLCSRFMRIHWMRMVDMKVTRTTMSTITTTRVGPFSGVWSVVGVIAIVVRAEVSQGVCLGLYQS